MSSTPDDGMAAWNGGGGAGGSTAGVAGASIGAGGGGICSATMRLGAGLAGAVLVAAAMVGSALAGAAITSDCGVLRSAKTGASSGAILANSR